VNEDLAATAIWGSQQLNLFNGARYDGVFAIWYGKGPGVDRSGDVLKHGNSAGTSKNGGVLAIAGDDHGAQSSTLAHQSEFNFLAAGIPVLVPANVQEYLDFGLFGFALSRYAGLWISFKAVTETVESSASVEIHPDRLRFVTPADFSLPAGGLNLRWPDDVMAQERRLYQEKIPAALAFARANPCDRLIVDGGSSPRIGLIAAGKAYLDLRQALEDLGIDEATAARLGLRLYKVGMSWPLEPVGIGKFAEGLDEILVVEEKRTLIETQIKDQLYNWPADRRPRIIGKTDDRGQPLLPSEGELSPTLVAEVLAARLKSQPGFEMLAERLARIEARERALAVQQANIIRTPYFCSGCPHNTSTRVPEGSRALAGIGCHFMAQWMNRRTATFTQMGGEGTPWIGQAPFTNEKHVFANIGDGTYYHSGLLAIRAAVAANVNITYKILFNDAVAMTGGQPVEGHLNVPEITRQVAAEGVKRVIVVTDEPEKYPANAEFALGVRVRPREELDAVQKELRDIPGVTVLVYDQTCAAEKRRRRKRGTFPDPARRVFINEAVCEGCGDCSSTSNCLSVEPAETEFGRKRHINQSSCNKDFSCLKGFCPSFVTVEGGSLRKASAGRSPVEGDYFAALPMPAVAALDKPYNILVAGVGGTGVITIGALLGMAAHIEGRGVSTLDMTGLAQKGGAVFSHIRLAPAPENLNAVRIGSGGADVLIGCDLVVTGSAKALHTVTRGGTRVVANSHFTPTADFTLNPDTPLQQDAVKEVIHRAAGDNVTEFVEATQIATALMGDAIATNLFLLGHAFQRGLIPISLAAIEAAIELNQVAVESNKRTFAWGRLYAHDPKTVEAAIRPATWLDAARTAKSLEEIIEHRAKELTAYQNAAYAKRYRDLVGRVEAAERERGKGMTGLTAAVAKYAYKLMACKDEYEVARLYTDGRFLERLKAEFAGDYRLTFHLAPPLFARRDAATGELQKRPYGPWVFSAFKLLTKLRGLRGSPFDIFGYAAERREERQLVADYFALADELAAKLTPENHAIAVSLAEIPEQIRGYGHIKARSLKAAKTREAELLALFRKPPVTASAAE
jgi:indolepyruvate ferredoxin oxidoreductase